MQALFKFGGINNVVDPASIPAEVVDYQVVYKHCVDIVNCDIDNSFNLLRRAGSTKATSDIITSATELNGVIYCVRGLRLCTFNGAVTTQISNYVVGEKVEFILVNDMVFFSDGIRFGAIADSVVILSNPSEWVDVLDLEQWVKDNYPADFDAAESNIEVDAFKLATMAGTCLEEYNGALYLAIDNFVYRTKSMDAAHMDIRYNVVAGFPSAVTGIKKVGDGLYIGTEAGVYFLQGGGLEFDSAGKVIRSFTQHRLLLEGAFKGSFQSAPGEAAPDMKSIDPIAIWTTSKGVYLGKTGGQCLNIGWPVASFSFTYPVTSMYRKLGYINQYIVGDGVTTYAVNLFNQAVSRYVDFEFSVFTASFGFTSHGTYALSGGYDRVGEGTQGDIEALVTFPNANFLTHNAVGIYELYLTLKHEGRLLFTVASELVPETDYLIMEHNGNSNVQVRKQKLPRGVSGQTIQLTMRNYLSSDFTIYEFKAIVTKLLRAT